MLKLHFGLKNAKLDKLAKRLNKRVATFSLLSGHTCPYAKDCLSMAIADDNGRRTIQDGLHTQFRCFSASQEVLFTNVYNTRKANGELVKLAAQSVNDATQAILANIPKCAGIIRIHVGGDFKTKAYMEAWIMAAHLRPNLLFYAYTKSLPFWVALKPMIPANFILTASYGGYKDNLIAEQNLRYSKVVFSESEAKQLKLPIDHDDYHAAAPKLRNKSFALLLHGVQPKGTLAAAALKALDGKGSYHRSK